VRWMKGGRRIKVREEGEVNEGRKENKGVGGR